MNRFVLFLATVAFFISCSDDDYLLTDYWGTVTAEYNGTPWTAYIQGTNNVNSSDFFNISCHVYNDQGFFRENLYIRNLPRTIGIYDIGLRDFDSLENRYAFYKTSTADGDVICDSYLIDEQAESPNLVEITRFDGNGRLIEGRYNLTFTIEDPLDKCNPNAPDTIRFTNGVFLTRIMR